MFTAIPTERVSVAHVKVPPVPEIVTVERLLLAAVVVVYETPVFKNPKDSVPPLGYTDSRAYTICPNVYAVFGAHATALRTESVSSLWSDVKLLSIWVFVSPAEIAFLRFNCAILFFKVY
jgi:hypothetical protein